MFSSSCHQKWKCRSKVIFQPSARVVICFGSLRAQPFQSCLTFCNPLDCSWPASCCPWDSCCALLQGIFPTQGLNSHLLHCWWIIYCWAPFASISCWICFWRNVTVGSCHLKGLEEHGKSSSPCDFDSTDGAVINSRWNWPVKNMWHRPSKSHNSDSWVPNERIQTLSPALC